ncbi:hypothetical protein METBIDRAFT_12994 [Metschnikowia bicuspidata var. bicuspidata NRRL YB-4993]|uniref:Uncharacterized protein n=1 Tax=Metschnikowia bicuspidata var. bicuspidata NRRL YB-4993 TaxID=869754 RepID=A0A1A0H7G3_9ASCO|nr:hypothetical protein METBIDRAFT_12994 [Metschnikowia bicuspidata var. bicuspidata NRRL YB-4993]OBA19966.1 hypothetical protein METBIDRAFT_12994 [Metschnikowia bicuspidata var. bicuspidata NRRL YB-4993]
MLFFSPALLLWLALALGAENRLQVQPLDMHHISSVDDLVPDDFGKHSVIFVKNESSVILPKFLHEKAHDPTFFQELTAIFNPKRLKDRIYHSKHYVQTQFSRQNLPANASEDFPLDGCFDNSLSETTSLVARSYEKTTLRQGSLNLFASLLGVEVDAGSNAGFTDISEEKIMCTVNPGRKLQLETNLLHKEMKLHRERNITIHAGSSGAPLLNFSEWKNVKGPNELEITIRTLSCVTDSQKIQC